MAFSLLLGSALLVGCADDEVGPEALPADGILQQEDDRFVFTYHLIFGSEGLFDRQADPECLRNLVTKLPDDAARLRKLLAARYGVADLVTLRETRREEIDQLESLGYL